MSLTLAREQVLHARLDFVAVTFRFGGGCAHFGHLCALLKGVEALTSEVTFSWEEGSLCVGCEIRSRTDVNDGALDMVGYLYDVNCRAADMPIWLQANPPADASDDEVKP